MADPARPPASRAVFLSYTTEDVAIALAVCEALREAGIEVWMDRSELQGGDAWDENIQRQIRECALIIPIISARTQARREGYFRLEWRLADERMRLVAEGTPLIVPVVADDTRQADALVPKSFLTVQWSRLPHGNVPPALVLRVRKLLGLETPGGSATLPPVPLPASLPGMAPVEDEPAIGRQNDKTAAPPPYWRRPLPVALGSSLVTALVLGVASWKISPASATDAEPKPVARFVETLPPGVGFRYAGRPIIAMSPDGQSFVYNTSAGLFLRKLSDVRASVIPGTEPDLYSPGFSPDGLSVAFWWRSPSDLQRISITGGAAIRVGPPADRGGMSWESDGNIFYGHADGIWRMPADGSTKPEQVIRAEPDERLSAPQLLPGGKYVLFSSNRPGGFQVEVRALSGGARKVVVPGGRCARYVPATGHLVYVVESDLFGVAFDLERLASLGNAVPLIRDVRLASAADMAHYSVSRDGTLLYLTGGAQRRVPVWVDRQGNEEALKLQPGEYFSVRVSPDGRKLAMAENSGGRRKFLIWDLEAETRTRLTQSGAVSGFTPLWTPDSLQIVFGGIGGQMQVQPVNNARPPEVVMNAIGDGRAGQMAPLFFTPDGQKIYFGESGRIGSIPVGTKQAPAWLVAPDLSGAVLSPDGKWVAYYLAESAGRTEVFVSPFPNVTEDRIVVSKDGGAQPLWSRDGKEIFYVGGTVVPAPLMVATLQTEGGKLSVVARKPVWNKNPAPAYFMTSTALVLRSYDLSPDGQRFIVLKDIKPPGAAEAPEQIFIVQNWTEELKRRVPRPRQ